MTRCSKKRRITVMPVSYKHLDVYKRQAVDDVTDGVDDVTDDVTDGVDKATDELTDDNGVQKDMQNNK